MRGFELRVCLGIQAVGFCAVRLMIAFGFWGSGRLLQGFRIPGMRGFGAASTPQKLVCLHPTNLAQLIKEHGCYENSLGVLFIKGSYSVGVYTRS